MATGHDTIRTKGDLVAPAQQRNRGKCLAREVRVRFVFEDVEFMLFQAFFAYRTDFGARWFLLPAILGTGIVNKAVRFANLTFNHTGSATLYWTVDATMEVRFDQ